MSIKCQWHVKNCSKDRKNPTFIFSATLIRPTPAEKELE